jgi:hypothetical protein
MTSPPAANADETANANATSFDNTSLAYAQWAFYSRPLMATSTGCSDTMNSGALCEFDDIVYMVPSSLLMSRMVAAGRLP